MSDSSPHHIVIAATELAELRRRLQWAELRVQVLEEKLRLERIAKYGPRSEKLSDLQLELLEGEPGVSREEVAAEAAREPLPGAPPKPARRRHPGRQELPAALPRVERVIPCAPADCTCAACGAERAVVGYDESEQLDVEPARYFVVVTRREKRACPRCADGVKAAPLPARILDKSLVSDRVIVDAVVAKYSDHLPLYRQSVILQREAGLEISRATLDGWVMRVGELLLLVREAMRRELLCETYLQADETPVAVQVRDGSGSNHRAYLWQYGRPGRGVVFDFQMSRARAGPRRFLDSFAGVLQTDAYAAYHGVGGDGLVHSGCWSHARRPFVEALKLNPRDEAAARLIARIDALFAVDAEAREAQLGVAERDALRQRKAVPVLAEMHEDLRGLRLTALPASALGKAVNYALTMWARLVRFLEYSEVELSNNLAENSMRPVALGRKNWIHIGSESAGPKVAAILSVVETCRRLEIPVRRYLGDILPGLADVSIQRVAELTPAAWKATAG